MASGPLVGGGGGDGSRDKHRWTESKVYTRKSFNKSRNAASQSQPSSQTLTATEDGSSSQQQPQPPAQPPQPQQLLSRFDAAATSDDSSSLNRRPVSAATASRDPPSSNGFSLRLENRIKINLSSRSKQDLRELRGKLSHELDQVRSLVKRIEARDLQLTGYSHSQLSANDAVDNGIGPAIRGNSEVASGSGPRPPPQLSVSVLEAPRVGSMADVVEKEKRTPKANQYYRNSEFLLGKDRLPPDSNKKLKTNGSKKFSIGDEDSFAMGAMDGNLNRAFKECGALLLKLMKHKHGWVFNTPVDVKGLGLHDYYTIIKRPMDLGTVKSRLNKNWYKSPREFAEDVRLTFRNAMTYNPKGQDVHIMAEQLLKIFEERWAATEVECNLDRFNVDHQLSPPTPHVTKKAPPAELRRTLERSESTNLGVDSKTKALSYTPTGRVAAPKKPKAKDPNKRDMTYEEKQKLSTNLMSLPPEKLDNIVQIIKKRNPALSQNDDEIEVDIESFDAETLWELDRFVVNYKKSLSKNKKKAELANQARVEAAANNVQDVVRCDILILSVSFYCFVMDNLLFSSFLISFFLV